MRTSYFKDIARSFQEGGSTFKGVGGKGQIIDGQYVEDFESEGPDPWRYRFNYTKKAYEVMDIRNPSRGWITLDGSTQKLKRAQKAVEDRFGSAKIAMAWFEKNGKEQLKASKNDATSAAPPPTPREPISIEQLPGRPMGPIGYERPPIQPPAGPMPMPPYTPPIEDLPQDGEMTEEDYRRIDEEMRRILEQDRINAEQALKRPYVDPPQQLQPMGLGPIQYQRPPIDMGSPRAIPPYTPPNDEDQSGSTGSPEADEMLRQIKIDAGLIPTVRSSGPYTVTSRVGRKNQSQNTNVSLFSELAHDSDLVGLVRDKDGKAFIEYKGYLIPYVKGDNWLGGSDYVGKYFGANDSNEDILRQLENELFTKRQKDNYKGGIAEYLSDLWERKSGPAGDKDTDYSSRIGEEDFYNGNYDLSKRFSLYDPYTYHQGFRQGGMVFKSVLGKAQDSRYNTVVDNTAVNKVYPQQSISYENYTPQYEASDDNLYFRGPWLNEMYGLLKDWRSRPRGKLENIYGVPPPMWKLPGGAPAEIGNVLEQAGWSPEDYWQAVSSWGAQREYMASDEYLNRLKNFLPASDAKKLQQKRLQYYDSSILNFDPNFLKDNPNVQGLMSWYSANNPNNRVSVFHNIKGTGSTLGHEGIHSSQTGLSLGKPSNYIGPNGANWKQRGGGRADPFTKKELSMISEDIKPIGQSGITDPEFYRYLISPKEYHAKLGSLRKLAFDLGVHKKYGENFTKKQIEDLKRVIDNDYRIQLDYGDVQQLFEISKGGQSLLNNLNKIAYEEPKNNTNQEFYDQPIMAQNGGRIVLGGTRGYKFY